MRILPASTEQIPLIQQLAHEIWPVVYADMISRQQIDYMLDMMYSEAALNQQFQDGHVFLIAYAEDQAVAFASYNQLNHDTFKLQKIYVKADQHGKGTGRELLDTVIQQVKEKGATKLQLTVNRENKAVGFYKKLGFTIIDEKDFDIGGGFQMNDYIMQKDI